MSLIILVGPQSSGKTRLRKLLVPDAAEVDEECLRRGGPLVDSHDSYYIYWDSLAKGYRLLLADYIEKQPHAVWVIETNYDLAGWEVIADRQTFYLKGPYER